MKPGNLILVAALTLYVSTCLSAHSTAYGRAIADVQVLANGLELFRRDYGQYPPPKNWWAELTGSSDAEINKGKVYVNILERKDPWGSDYQYNLLDMGAAKLTMVYSLGKDKATETFGHDADDISSWRDYKIPLNHYQPPLFTRQNIFIGSIVSISYISLLLYFRSKTDSRKT